MKNELIFLPLTLIVLALIGCSSEDGVFVEGGGSSSNIISDINFGLGADEPNPAVVDDEGAHGSVAVELTVTAGDRNNLKVTSGTVFFKSQYGLLSSGSCNLDSTGQCSVTWTSILDGIPNDLLADITAYTLGEESYLDVDGSGNFNDGDIVLTDTSEPFIDFNHDRVFDAGVDIPIDLDDSLSTTGTAHTSADGRMSVSDCTHSSLCATASNIYIFDQLTLNLDAQTPAP